MGWLIAVFLLIVIIFGVSSGMDSYATAQQARATIEVAQVAQVSAWGNLVTILTIALALVIFVALAAVVLWILYYRRSTLNAAVRNPRPRNAMQVVPPSDLPPMAPPSLETLIQLETLRMLRDLHAPASLPAPREEEPVDEPFHWLK